jgi:hypothetical protein
MFDVESTHGIPPAPGMIRLSVWTDEPQTPEPPTPLQRALSLGMGSALGSGTPDVLNGEPILEFRFASPAGCSGREYLRHRANVIEARRHWDDRRAWRGVR